MKNNLLFSEISFSFSLKPLISLRRLFYSKPLLQLTIVFMLLSIVAFTYWYLNDMNLLYPDSRSHLNIARRVIDNLKPGIAQLGSVWLPLPHVLMLPTIWSDFMWHSGLSGAIISMTSYVITGLIIFKSLRKLDVSMWASVIGAFVFALNINVLYLQSTSMTELLLICVMSAAVYRLVDWFKADNLAYLIQAAFFIFLSTLIRYDGWFLFMIALTLISVKTLYKKGYKTMEGTFILFSTLAGFGIILWFLWNLAIYNDPLFFALGPYSARSQQKVIEEAGMLFTKGNVYLSFKTYIYAIVYNTNLLTGLFGFLGSIVFWLDKKITTNVKIGYIAILSPLVFNIMSLFFGHSVINVNEQTSGWFNIRYGLMMMPACAIFTGFLFDRLYSIRNVLISLWLFVLIFSYLNLEAVTLEDAESGMIGFNEELIVASEELGRLTKNKEGLILISTAKHDPLIFSSKLPLTRFIHEGTSLYWENSLARPERWARWLVFIPNDMSDAVFKGLTKADYKEKYNLIRDFNTVDIYELKPEFYKDLNKERLIQSK